MHMQQRPHFAGTPSAKQNRIGAELRGGGMLCRIPQIPHSMYIVFTVAGAVAIIDILQLLLKGRRLVRYEANVVKKV